jgi:hypothetical protein
MMALSMWDTLGYAKTAAATLGVTGVLYSAYSVSGLPVPATVYQVDQRIERVRSSIQSVNVEVLETQRSVNSLRRSALRAERYLLSKTDPTVHSIRRLGEIDDELIDITKKDDVLGNKVQSIKNGARAPAT